MLKAKIHSLFLQILLVFLTLVAAASAHVSPTSSQTYIVYTQRYQQPRTNYQWLQPNSGNQWQPSGPPPSTPAIPPQGQRHAIPPQGPNDPGQFVNEGPALPSQIRNYIDQSCYNYCLRSTRIN